MFYVCGGLLGLMILWLVIARIIRQRYHFPIPYFMVYLIDNPLRRWVQPLDKAPERLGLKPGMKVLEIGPGSGTYTLAAAKAVGPSGKIIALDIEEKIVKRLRRRVETEAIHNIEVQVGDAQSLEFDAQSFDAIYAIAVIGEIPDRLKALSEFARVLVPGGSLAISEFLPDPDSQAPKRLQAECESVGFEPQARVGNWLHYTLLFTKTVS
jgi:ubiquinone/menaquinone biosynthesis C-methylase UbiE